MKKETFQPEFKEIERLTAIHAKRLARPAKGEPCKDWQFAEFDFRGVTECDLSAAIAWEYAREHKATREALVRWLNTRTGSATNRQKLWRNDSTCTFPDIAKKARGERVRLFLFLCRSHAAPLFPLPWLALHQGQRNACNARGFRKPSAGFPILRYGEQITLTSLDLSNGSDRDHTESVDGSYFTEGWYLMRPDFKRQSVTELVNNFSKWAHAEAKRVGTKRGKASQLPFHKLKQLAALRLRNCGMSYARAQSFLASHAKNVRAENPFDLLPFYASDGAWQDAIEAARAELKALD